MKEELDMRKRASSSWTTTIPQKSGFYWARSPYSRIAAVCEVVEGSRYYMAGSELCLDETEFPGALWWPIPLEAPEF